MTAAVSTPPEDILAPLPKRFRSALLSMYANEPQCGSDGVFHALDTVTRISPAQGMWLYELCRELNPKQTAEIGLAYGFSTIYFLAALHENGTGSHTAIDPFQGGPYWHGIGFYHAETLATSDGFRFINKNSFPALVDLAAAGERFEVVFIDGSHRFDDALIDFTLAAELCPLGGYVLLDDMWMPSIQRAASFIRRNRTDFAEVATPISNIAAFKRTGHDERQWNHHVDF
jgi:hypothetical protein